MKGCRPLTDSEIKLVSRTLSGGKYGLRDKTMFILGIRTGFRITELLSLKVKDVWQHGQVVNAVTVQRRNMKKQKEGRTIPLHREARQALVQYLESLDDVSPETPLFKSQKGDAISRVQAYRILQTAFDAAKLTGNVATHSMRKTFAKRVYRKVNNDIFMTQQALGHENIETTVQYLSFAREDLNRAILSD